MALMQNYKEVVYSNYVTAHNNNLYGVNTLLKIRKHFPSWAYYFGKHLPIDKAARILDLGCGDGNFVYWLAQRGFSKVTGIDVSAEQIQTGMEMGISNIIVADISDYLQNRKDEFDFICVRDVLEHFTKDEVFQLLGLIKDALKPGGILLAQVPNGQGLFYTSIFYGDVTHEWAYTQSSLHQVFSNCGFNKISCFEMGPAPVNVSGFVRFLFWRYKVWVTRFWKFVESGNHKGIFTSNIIAVAIK